MGRPATPAARLNSVGLGRRAAPAHVAVGAAIALYFKILQILAVRLASYAAAEPLNVRAGRASSSKRGPSPSRQAGDGGLDVGACGSRVCGEVRVARNISCSSAMPWSRDWCVVSRRACLAAASEWRGCAASGAAQSRAASRNPSLGKMASMRPSSSAYGAVSVSPLRMRRAALGRPMTRAGAGCRRRRG
jgi:hypothetical protein